MADEIKLEAQARTVAGSGAAGRLRRDGWLPGVLNTIKGASHAIQLQTHAFEVMLQHHASENLIVDLSVDGKKPLKALLKDVQHDPLSGDCLHLDFLEISMTEKMQANIPIELVGESHGVIEGGVLEHILREVEVECLPTDLVEALNMDVSGLGIGDSLSVADLQAPPGIEILTDGSIAVAAVAAPRVAEEAEAEEGAEEGAEGEGAEGEAKEGEEAEPDS
jgi:large subunit ribosomal protein L25